MRYSIRSKIFLGFFSLIFVFSITVTIFVLRITTQELEKRTGKETLQQVQMAVDDIDDYLEQIRSVYLNIIADEEILNALEKVDGNNYTYIMNKFDTLLSSYKNVYSIYLYDINSNTFFNGVNSTSKRIKNKEWIELAKKNDRQVNFAFVEDDNSTDNGNVSLMMYPGSIRNNYFGESRAYISVNASKVFMKEIVYPDKTSDNAKQYILDEKDNIIFGGENEKYTTFKIEGSSKSGYYISGINKIDYLITFSTSDKYKWKYVQMLPVSEVYKGVNYIKNILISMIIVFLFISLLLAYVLSNHFTRPIYDLKELMAGYRSNTGSYKQINTKRKDEFRYLFDSYNDLIKRTDHLIDEVYKVNLYKKEIELRMIQGSINPHFIYNILDSVNWILQLGEYEKASEVLKIFSKYLRSMLNINRDYTSIAELKSELINYCELQKFFHNDSVNYEINISDDILNYSIMTSLLQPVVENAYIHGFKGGKRSGSIKIDGFRYEKGVAFCVCDDGVGIDEATIKKINDKIRNKDLKSGNEYFGLHSAHQRLKLAYGEEYGLEILSNPGEGTCIRIMTKIFE